ncbi:MAG: Arm DNA-binding domain-containing protein, partial [Bacteroidales bacterium]|nr:Arm DNA-binding domain-containing protein [Bacteroidales bacterium]
MPTQFYLASQTNKTGERRILISVHIKGVRALTSIGYSISPENWNEDKGQVKKGAKNSKGIDYLAINSRIHDLTSKFESLEAHEATPTKEEILMLVANTIGRGSSNEPESTLFFLHYDEFLK